MGIGSGTKGLHYAWLIVIGSVAAVAAALGFGRFGYTMILPSMKEGLRLSDLQAADLATGNMVGYLVLSVLSGLLAARYGSRAVVSISMLFTCLSMALTGVASSYPAALLARTLTGMGSGGVNVPVMALVAIWFAPKRRGLATGITVGGASLGLLITGLLVPPILNRYGSTSWRFAWYSLAAISLFIGLLCAALLRNRPADKGLLPLGGAIAEPAEKAGSSPAFQWRLVYTSKQIWHLAAVYVMFGFSYVIYATFFVRYLTGEAGLTIQRAGSLWSAVGMLSLISGIVWGSVSDRLGRKYGLALVFLVQAVSFTLFRLGRGPAGPYASALLFAVTAWSVPAIMAASVGDLLGPRLAPAAFGFVSFFLSVGQALGPFAAGRIAQMTGSFAGAFQTAGAAAFLGAVGSLLLRFPKEAR